MQKIDKEKWPSAFVFLSGAMYPRLSKEKFTEDRDFEGYTESMIKARDAHFTKSFLTHPFAYSLVQSIVGRAKNSINKIDRPTMIFQGTNDRLVDPKGATLIYDKIDLPIDMKEIHIIEGGPHHLLETKDGHQYIEMIKNFLDTKIS